MAVPSFHIKLGSLPSALGRMEQHSVMAIEKELEKNSVPGAVGSPSVVNEKVAPF